MTTLPSISPATAAPSRPSDARRSAVEHVRLAWRVLRRDAHPGGLRGGDVRCGRVEATLSDTDIVLRRIEASREVSVLVLPAHMSRHDTSAGTLLEWTLADSSNPDAGERMIRILVTAGAGPLVRCDLLDRLGVDGGRYEVVDVDLTPVSPAD